MQCNTNYTGNKENLRFVNLNVSVKGMRIIDKIGIEQVLKNIKSRGK